MKRVWLSFAAWAARLLPIPVKRALYGFKPLAGLIRSGLNRAAPEGITIVEIAAGGLAGMQMCLDLQTEKDYWLGTYETELQSTIEALVSPGMAAYDVGANIGYVSLLLARQVGAHGQVFAFEALPENLERLRQNVELNQLSDRVHIIPKAVVDQVQSVNFMIGPSDDMGKAQGSAGRQEFTYQEIIEVPGISLDSFVYDAGQPAPEVIKMDIEGGEVLALPGMRRLLAEARPLILIELHGSEAAQVVWRELKKASYDIHSMQHGYPIIPTLDNLDWKTYLVATPKENP
jgi:FkbM family methyltransferase